MWHLARMTGFGGLLATLLILTGASDALAQKKDKKADLAVAIATPADYLIMQKNKDVSGKVVSVSGTTIAFHVDTPTMEPNPNYKPPTVTNPKSAGYNAQANQQYQQLRQYQDIQRLMAEAAKARTPQEKQRAMQRLQQDMARFQMDQQRQYAQQMAKAGKDGKNPAKTNPNSEPFKLVHHLKLYEFELQDAVVLRKMYLATEFDDIGNIKEYTEKEKKELRGDDKTKPGYLAKMDEVLPGTEAKLYLAAPKATKKDDPKGEDGVGNVERSTVRMIILTKASLTPAITGGGAPKKKDKK